MIKFNPPTQIECGWEQSTITTSCLFFPSFKKKDFEGKISFPFSVLVNVFFFFSLLVCRAFFRISRVALYVMSTLCNAEHQTCRLVLNCYLPFVIDQHHWRKKKKASQRIHSRGRLKVVEGRYAGTKQNGSDKDAYAGIREFSLIGME